jgi:hypothetical protein
MGRVAKVRERNLSTQALLRAYYFEVVTNLEFLDSVDFDKLDGLALNSPPVKTLLSGIHNDLGFAILFKEDLDSSKDLLSFLGQKGRLEKSDEEGAPPYENVLQAVSFTVVKSETLKRLSALGDEEISVLTAIMLKKRLLNIRSRFLIVKRKMDELGPLKSLAR